MLYNDNIDPAVWEKHAWRNRLQSLLLLSIMAGFVFLLGYILWGGDGIILLLVVGLAGVIFSPSFSPWVIMRMYGASRLSTLQAPVLMEMVGVLSERAGLRYIPQVYYLPTRILNSFAVGSRDKAAIGVTDGLLRQMDQHELAGILAHEISHIRGNDLRVMGIADLFSRATSLLSLIGQVLLLVNLPLILFSQVKISWLAIVLLIFAPSLSTLAQLALSRTREFTADMNAVRLTGDPAGLASALAKIEQRQGNWIEHIFMPGRRIPDPSLLRTHPQTEQRIAHLMELKSHTINPAYRDLFSNRERLEPGHSKNAVKRKPRWHVNGLWH